MKTVSEQLKDLGLSHGDMCEIEGRTDRYVVMNFLEALAARSANGSYWNTEHAKVTCGWRASEPILSISRATMSIHYEKVLPEPEFAPLPKAVEKAIDRAFRLDADAGWREIARAIIAECKK